MSKTTRTYWLLFRNSENESFAKFFLKDGFHHIDVITRDDFNWLFFSPRNNRFEWEIFSHEIEEDVPKLFHVNHPEFTILKVETKIIKDKDGKVEHGKRPNLSFLHILNCVGISKYFLGVWPSIFTPFSLYKWLLKYNGDALKVEKLL